MHDTTHQHRKTCMILFVLLLSMYGYFHQGGGDNQNARLDLLHAIVSQHTVIIDAYHGNTSDVAAYNSHFYNSKAPGTVALALPSFVLAAVGLSIAHVPLDTGSGWRISDWFATVGSVGVLTALGGVALYSLLAHWTNRRIALLTTLGMFLGSLPFPYATMLFSHAETIGLLSIALWAVYAQSAGRHGSEEASPLPMTTVIRRTLYAMLVLLFVQRVLLHHIPHILFLFSLCALAAYLLFDAMEALFRYCDRALRRTGVLYGSLTFRREVIAGTALGFALAGEYTAGVAVLAILLLAAARFGLARMSGIARWMVLPMLLLPLYGWLCFGSPFTLGYSHEAFFDMKQGFFGIVLNPQMLGHMFFLLFSPARGLVFWSPVLLLSVIGLPVLFRRLSPIEKITFLLAPLIHLLLIANYQYFDGGYAFSARHLAPVIPLLALPVAFGIRELPRIGAALVFLSIGLMTLGTSLDAMTPQGIEEPITQHYLPRLLQGDFVSNLGMVTGGLSGVWSFLPLALLAGVLVAWFLIRTRSSVRQSQLRLLSVLPPSLTSVARSILHREECEVYYP